MLMPMGLWWLLNILPTKMDIKRPELFKIISSPSMRIGTNPNLNPSDPNPHPSLLHPDPPALPLLHLLPHQLPLLPVTMIWLPELLLNWLRSSEIPYQTVFKLTKGRLFMDTWGIGIWWKNGNMYRPYWLLQMALHFDSIIRSIYNATTTHLSKNKFRIKIWFTLLNLVSLSRTINPVVLSAFLKYILLALSMFFWIYLLSKVFFVTVLRVKFMIVSGM